MNLKLECNKLGLKVSEFCLSYDMPVRTMQDWTKSHPKRVRAFLDAELYRQSKEKDGDSHLQEELL
ncbi:MAG: hypothetical protein GY787_21040 [Alteromonadales bacterium]|nr:hypothetical protein [Alteromonadales bacterium]